MLSFTHTSRLVFRKSVVAKQSIDHFGQVIVFAEARTSSVTSAVLVGIDGNSGEGEPHACSGEVSE